MTSEIVWIEKREVLAIHEKLLVLHGGAAGVRDDALLQSALARPRRQAAIYADDSTVHDLAALYTAGIVKNHPFVDGKKRTGFLLGLLFLELNGFVFAATQEVAANAILALAEGSSDEKGYAAFLRKSARPRR